MRGGGRGGMGGGMSYTTGTPIVEGDTIYVTGRSGTARFKIEKQGDSFAAKELWSNPDAGTAFNTPVLKDGMLYGLAGNDNLFCINAKTGAERLDAFDRCRRRHGAGGARPGGPGGGGPAAGGRGGMRGGGGRSQPVSAPSLTPGRGPVGLSPAGELIVFKPGRERVRTGRQNQSRGFADLCLSDRLRKTPVHQGQGRDVVAYSLE